MTLLDLIHRPPVPEPWAEGEKIPWDEPGFSARMLQEHLSQDHDWASRRFDKIDAHVAWIHRDLLSGRPSRILDLGCGPGLYAARLARLGHQCLGIDFSPASIAYAVETATSEGLDCTYLQQDLRTADYGTGYNLAMLIYGEFNVFRPQEAEAILRKAHAALSAGGILLLEPSTFEAVQQEGQQGPSWYAAASGLFSAEPHLCLMENFWHPARHTTTNRYHVIDAATGRVTRYASTSQAYTDRELQSMLEGCGFAEAGFYPALTGTVDPTQGSFVVLVARKHV